MGNWKPGGRSLPGWFQDWVRIMIKSSTSERLQRWPVTEPELKRCFCVRSCSHLVWRVARESLWSALETKLVADLGTQVQPFHEWKSNITSFLRWACRSWIWLPSICGFSKSTLFGALRPPTRKVYICSVVLASPTTPHTTEQIGGRRPPQTSQKAGMVPHMKIRQNQETTLPHCGVSRPKKEREVEESLVSNLFSFQNQLYWDTTYITKHTYFKHIVLCPSESTPLYLSS